MAKSSPPEVRQAAEIVAIRALSFLGGEPARLGRFLAETGLGPETLRAAAESPQFLLAVLDFLLKDAAMVEEFTGTTDLPISALTSARLALGGPDWAREDP